MLNSPDARATPNLPLDAREAVHSLFRAMSAWQDEVGASTGRCNETVLNNIAATARAFGWPNELIETLHQHLALCSKIQLGMFDTLADAWQRGIASLATDQLMIAWAIVSNSSNKPILIAKELFTAPVLFWSQVAKASRGSWALSARETDSDMQRTPAARAH